MASVKWHRRDADGAIIVTFDDAEFLNVSSIQYVGTKWIEALGVAASESHKLIVDFNGVLAASSALIGKMVLLNKKAKADSVALTFRNTPPAIDDFLRRLGGDGGGVGARLKRPPSHDSGHAVPERNNDD